jgi:hypothetical protein
MAKSASRPSGGESRLDIFYEFIVVPCLAIENYSIKTRPQVLSMLANDWALIYSWPPSTQRKKMIIDDMFEDTEALITNLWKFVDSDGEKS